MNYKTLFPVFLKINAVVPTDRQSYWPFNRSKIEALTFIYLLP